MAQHRASAIAWARAGKTEPAPIADAMSVRGLLEPTMGLSHFSKPCRYFAKGLRLTREEE